jgi:hypothetical protein
VTTESTDVLVLSDSRGNYYLVPRTVLDRARVPDAHKGEVERLLQSEEVKGYLSAETSRGIILTPLDFNSLNFVGAFPFNPTPESTVTLGLAQNQILADIVRGQLG